MTNRDLKVGDFIIYTSHDSTKKLTKNIGYIVEIREKYDASKEYRVTWLLEGNYFYNGLWWYLIDYRCWEIL